MTQSRDREMREFMAREARKLAEPIDWALCDRIAALPESAYAYSDRATEQIDLLLELGSEEQDRVFEMLEGGAVTSIGQAIVELRFFQLGEVWWDFSTLEQRHKVLRYFWDHLDRTHRHRLQVELGIGHPWPHNDFRIAAFEPGR